MKIRIIFLSLLAFIIFCGASPWEGAGAAAPNGELPATGRYVATNAFPRNTVVDILNIETNKSTRAIVANTLDSPGLLAVVSREAADLIGMRQGSVSRIRMTQPSDPIAYSRFTDAIESGITDYDSGELYPEEPYVQEEYVQDDYIPPAPEPEERPFIAAETTPRASTVNEPAINREIPPEVSSANVPQNGSLTPGYVLEPEWGGNRTRDIVDLPEYAVNGGVVILDEEESEPVEIVEQEPEENIEEIAEQEPEENVEEIAEQEPEENIEEIAEYEPEEEYPEEPIEEIAEISEYDIVPADERPPENGIYGIDPADIIPEIVQVTPEVTPEPEPVDIITPIAPPVSDTDFSVPRIYELAQGWYYVQVAALDSVESVESTVDKIDRSYQPVVYKDGDHWYRVLLGPLNQGESAAILQRFKSIGYKDAFVRRAR